MSYIVKVILKDSPGALKIKGGDDFEDAVAQSRISITGSYLEGPLLDGNAYVVIPSSSVDYIVVEEGE